MILWTASTEERSIWAKVFEDLIPVEFQSITVPKLRTTNENEFISTLYTCLVPIMKPTGEVLDQTIEYQIKIEQKGYIMKTSQVYYTNGIFQQKYFHLRYYVINA